MQIAEIVNLVIQLADHLFGIPRPRERHRHANTLGIVTHLQMVSLINRLAVVGCARGCTAAVGSDHQREFSILKHHRLDAALGGFAELTTELGGRARHGGSFGEKGC